MVSERASMIVAAQALPGRDMLTTTAFFADLWRDFPALQREMRAVMTRRKASGRIAEAALYAWIVGTGDLYIAHSLGRGTLVEYPYSFHPHMPRGRVLLAVVEWDSAP